VPNHGSVCQDVKYPLAKFMGAVGDNQGHRVRRGHWQIRGEPLPPSAAGAAQHAVRRGVLALLIEVALRLHSSLGYLPPMEFEANLTN